MFPNKAYVFPASIRQTRYYFNCLKITNNTGQYIFKIMFRLKIKTEYILCSYTIQYKKNVQLVREKILFLPDTKKKKHVYL